MEILSFFTPSEPIAGLEISEEALRLVLLETVKVRKAPETTKVVCAVEEPLGEGIIENGFLKSPQAFSVCLARLIKKAKVTIRYVVVTFSNPKVYTKLYLFPNTLGDEKIRDAVRLTVGHQLPLKPDDYYLDWKKHDHEGKKEVLLAGAPRSLVEGYNKVLSDAGVHIVATELSPISVARLLPEAVSVKPILLIIENRDSFTQTILKNGLVRFNRIIPFAFCDRSLVPQEARKMADYYESENKEKVYRILRIGGSVEVTKEKSKTGDKWPLPVNNADTEAEIPEGLTIPGVFLPALGAAKRGVIPRSEDNHISLMSVGTETAYETQKALVFTEFISHLIIGLAALIAIIFVGLWSLTLSLQKTKGQELAGLRSFPVPKGSTELEANVLSLNGLLQDEGKIVKSIPRWSIVVDKLMALTGPGITINNLSLPSVDGVFSITGVAVDRPSLRAFKASLEQETLFTAVDMPISNISQKDNIPFSVTFRLRDIQSIYYH